MNDSSIKEQPEISSREAQKQRNIENNTKNVRVAADIAALSNNPYAKAIGTAVKTADKISGGKASEKLGKHVTSVSKFAPGGRLAQNASNKLSESGTSDRIGAAVNAKNKGKVFFRKNYVFYARA
jgi:hypothetical protein